VFLILRSFESSCSLSGSWACCYRSVQTTDRSSQWFCASHVKSAWMHCPLRHVNAPASSVQLP